MIERLKLNIEQAWYAKAWWMNFLLPFSWIYKIIITIRRKLYQFGLLKRKKFDIPVIVVGNILAGGTHKTPMVAYVANYLLEKNYKVGILSHGYKSKLKEYPHEVSKNDKAAHVGDEAYLLYQKLACPVVVDSNRIRGIEYLIKNHSCDAIVCDDGLQHLALNPSISIVLHPFSKLQPYVHCLPAGPLREPLSELDSYDIKVDITEGSKEICHIAHFNFSLVDKNGDKVDVSTLMNKPVTVVTGIARPQRLIDSLTMLGLKPQHKFFPDHYVFEQSDFEMIYTPVIMTLKDWVKCKDLRFNQKIYIADLDIIPCMMFHKQLDRLL